MTTVATNRKKLIEVALPLQAINTACANEASPFTPRHPRSLHVWWARRRLAAARAVIFAQMVDDPSCYVDQLKGDAKLRRKAESLLKARHQRWEEAVALAEKARQAGISAPEPGPEPTLDGILAEEERQRLFRIIEELVKWENTTNEEVLQRAREEIWQSWRRACAENAGHPRAKELFDRHKLPAFHDPFAGGGALPMEAQRLGLEAYASDLNPVAVLINKAMIEIPPKFAGRPPVNPESRQNKGLLGREWKRAQGLAEDVRYYGRWMRGEAEKRIGHLYPEIEITAEMAEERPDLKPLVGRQLTVIAWLWARTVKSPNPAFRNVEVPLASTFMLSTKPGKEAWVEPVIDDGGYRFIVKTRASDGAFPAEAKAGTKLARGANFRCVMSGTPIPDNYIKAESMADRMGTRLMAIVAEGDCGRVYLPPTLQHEAAANKEEPAWKPDQQMSRDTRDLVSGRGYGFYKWADLFAARQLVALTTFSDLVPAVIECIRCDAIIAGLPDDDISLRDGGVGCSAYAEAIGVYFGLAISRWTDLFCGLSSWNSTNQNIKNLFSRQAIPMVWDYAESNPFGCGATFSSTVETIVKLQPSLPCSSVGASFMLDARFQMRSADCVISTDPPYFDNINYAELSDFFYVWLRQALRAVYPDLFSTLVVPKADELVASSHRHGGKKKAEAFFLSGMRQAMHRLSVQAHPAFPITIYYAFKQTEEDSGGTASTGWEVFLESVIQSNLSVTGTWPVRTERTEALKRQLNALASSIVLVCRPRPADAPTATRREFVAALQRELPEALRHLQAGNIAPVDLAQAAIGPGMAVFTRYAQVLDAQGKALTVREALVLINETLDTALAEQEGDFDPDSHWALAWFEQHGFEEGEYGVAETLSKAKNTSVSGLADAGILASSRGKVRLLRPDELPATWNPATNDRLTHWEAVHHLIRALNTGEVAASELLAAIRKVDSTMADAAREFAYRLYSISERKKRATDALGYNALVQAWPELVKLAQGVAAEPVSTQGQLL